MVRRKESLAFLDTHILVWLYAGLTDKLSEKAKETIEMHDLLISQFSRLELHYLHEIGRIIVKPSVIIQNLKKAINLKPSEYPLDQIVDEALGINWTRDVFDRLIIAEVKMSNNILVTADSEIRNNFSGAIW